MQSSRHSSLCFSFILCVAIGLLISACASPAAPLTPTSSSASSVAPLESPTVPVEATQPLDDTPAQPTLPPTPLPYLPETPVWGIETYYLGPDPSLDLVKQSGAFWVRRNALLWSDVEPEPGSRNWQALSGLELELQNAAAEGLQVILVVRSTPAWAQSLEGSFCSPPTKESLAAFGNFLRDAVARYSLPPYNVQYWEIGNEPDVAAGLVASDSPFGCWGLASDPFYGGAAYADILKAVYPSIKLANPQAQVLVGGLLLDCDPRNPPEIPAGSGNIKDCTPARFLEGALQNGAGEFFDGISFHAYDYYAGQPGVYNNANWASASETTGPVLIAKTSYLRQLLEQYGVPGKALYNTEAALLCGRDGSEPECQGADFERTKAIFLAEAYAAAIAERLDANVWYSLTGWRASGLLDGGMEPNLAYQAFQTSVSQLKGAAFISPLGDFPGIKGYIFENNGAPLWLAWAADGKARTLQLDWAPFQVVDFTGSKLEPTASLTIDRSPVYIYFSPVP